MTKYIQNVNTYLSQKKIKQTFVSLKSGIDSKKLSRILNSKQSINDTDMEKIAKALGKTIEYFLSDNFVVQEDVFASTKQAVFYAGEPSGEQEEFALQLIELVENVDEVLGAKGRFEMIVGE